MKTILFLLEAFPSFGGIEGVTICIANALVEKYNIIICSVLAKDTGILARLNPRIKVLHFPVSGLDYSIENVEFLNQLIDEKHISTLIYQDSYFPNEYLLKKIRNRNRLKIIIVEHSTPNYYQISYKNRMQNFAWWNLKDKLKMRLFHGHNTRRDRSRRTLLYELCDKYVVLSESLKQIVLEESYIKSTYKLKAIGNPLSFSQPTVDFSMKEKQCLYVGRLDVMKGIDRLMHIWSKVEEHTPDWKLTIVGDGIKMQYVKDFVNKKKLSRVEIEGFKSNVQDYYRTAQVFCMCSTFEGFPLVLPEAMSYGVVPIAFNSFPALQDIITDGVDGYTIPAFDEDAYSKQLMRIMSDSENLYSIQRKGIETSLKFDIHPIVGEWIELFEE